VDFKSKTRDGIETIGRFRTKTSRPYYDKVESYIGFSARRKTFPVRPNGIFLLLPKPRCHERLVKQACDKLNITWIPARLAILTESAQRKAARATTAGNVGRGCTTASNFSRASIAAAGHGNRKLTLITGAMAREIVVGKAGKAEAVRTWTKRREPKSVYAKAIVVAASAANQLGCF